MATLAYAPLFAREDRPPDSFWISLQYFNLYRIVVALVFLGATYVAYEPINFGAYDMRLFRAVCVGYLILGIALQFVLRSVHERFNLQLSAHALLDVLTIPLLMYASGGMRRSAWLDFMRARRMEPAGLPGLMSGALGSPSRLATG